MRIAALAALAVFLLAATAAGCGGSGSVTSTVRVTSTTVASAASTDVPVTIAPTSIPTAPLGTDVTVIPSMPDGSQVTSTVLTGTTVPQIPQAISLTFVGPMTTETWQALRAVVNKAAADGDRVRAGVKALSAGEPVNVDLVEVDAFSGVGFAAGANTSQPVAVAVDDSGQQYLVFAFSITGKPEATTIVGFERKELQHVGLVEGPLPVSDKTHNITTVP